MKTLVFSLGFLVSITAVASPHATGTTEPAKHYCMTMKDPGFHAVCDQGALAHHDSPPFWKDWFDPYETSNVVEASVRRMLHANGYNRIANFGDWALYGNTVVTTQSKPQEYCVVVSGASYICSPADLNFRNDPAVLNENGFHQISAIHAGQDELQIYNR